MGIFKKIKVSNEVFLTPAIGLKKGFNYTEGTFYINLCFAWLRHRASVRIWKEKGGK